MSSTYRQVLGLVAGTPWAIRPEAGQRILAVLARRAAGVRYSVTELRELLAEDAEAYHTRREAARAATRTVQRVAVVPVYGTILGRDWEFAQASHGGTTSAEALSKALRSIDADQGIGAVVLDFDSPGGSVTNLAETADVIAGMQTPVVAQVTGQAASAAYWLASQAREIVISPSSEVGSIGVYTMHVDMREQLAAEGLSVDVIRAGENKVAANPYEELTPAARADIQSAVDEFHGMFVAAVARGRGTTPKRVRSEFGDGLVFRAKEAVRRGMADRIGTLDETLARVASGKVGGPRALASSSGAVNHMSIVGRALTADEIRAMEALTTTETEDETAKNADGWNALFGAVGAARERGSELVSIDPVEGERNKFVAKVEVPIEVSFSVRDDIDPLDEIEIRERELAL